MSDGDEEPDETAETPEETADEEATELSVETLDVRLDEAETELDAAETEAELDDVEAQLDDVESDIEAADLPEPDDEDEEEDPQESLETRVSALRDDLEAQRGPYAEDAVADVEESQSTMRDTRWTEQGEQDLQATVNAFLDDAADVLGETFTGGDTADPDVLADDLDQVVTAIEAAALHPDTDEETITELVEATDGLVEGVEDAQEWDDLSVRQKLQFEGYYDVINQKHKDFPPELSALKEWKKRGNVEMILLALDHLGDTDFMEEYCMDALLHIGSEDALEKAGELAARRDLRAIEVIGKIGSGDGVEHVIDYVDSDSNRKLQTTAIKALGEIGSEEATQDVADQLVADDEGVRSQAARSLGLIGDTRAIDPLTDVLADDDSDTVRTSAAWALVQVGTEDALKAAAEYTDDRSYIVQQEAQKADDAIDAGAAPTA